jgi:hypothetical protein
MRVIERKLKFLSGQIKTKYMEEPLFFKVAGWLVLPPAPCPDLLVEINSLKNLSTKVAINEYHLVINFEVLEKKGGANSSEKYRILSSHYKIHSNW